MMVQIKIEFLGEIQVSHLLDRFWVLSKWWFDCVCQNLLNFMHFMQSKIRFEV